jgi:N-acetylmuramoyl-L-alanine amidase
MTSTDWDIFGRTLYGEARGELFEGQVAVAWVILNRVKRQGWYGKTVSEVCLKPYQFSCWLETDPNYQLIKAATYESPTLRRCLGIVALCESGDLPDPTGDAINYYSDSIPPPRWVADMTQTTKIGHHLFFTERVNVITLFTEQGKNKS